jgi:hypothetical protein
MMACLSCARASVRSGARIEILKVLGEGREGTAVTLGACGLGEMIDRGKKAFSWGAPRPDPIDPDVRTGRGVAEVTLNGAAPAIAIAIHDAVGAWVREWPFTPERVLRAMGRLP